MPNRDDCLQLDAHDPLAPLRAAFELPPSVVYLDGNSLGARPRAAAARAAQVVQQEWGEGLIRSWNSAGWFALPRRLGDRLAPLIGAGAGEVLVTDTTSVNLFKLLGALLRLQHERDARRRVIVSERGNFPTDLHIAQGLARMLRQGHELRLVDRAEDIPAALGDDVAVLMLTQVDYRTGALHDMAALTRLAHERGALALWDLAHSAGALPVDLRGADADAAVGCTYKYLNGGPGAPAFLWIAPRWQGVLETPLSGWWGHAEPFAMEPQYRPDAGIGRFLCGTQGIVSQALVECGLEVFERTDMAAVRHKSLALTDLFIALVEQRCGAHPLTLITPRQHERRGSQVSWQHPQGYAVMQALIGRGVIGDYREPGILRFGFTPLYTRFIDVWDAVEALRAVLDGEEWKQERFQVRTAVT
ncbi:kynureninase [Azohydromonas caseinilytica]|uniref:Kynureninase n=1 Tax=Azohydromonas caseinilytica TaxID=2728836 RepID=A0A848FCH7_9BURK|nr:kynureninase [Azohydromonas caseinilytica]NML15880.1 kynureninase [Azohydromonas caseinilytica]